MWIIFLLLIGLPVLWIVALNVDARFFGGRFLIKAKTTREEFRRSLEAVMRNKDRPITDWDVEASDWLHDKMNIPLQDPALEKMRQSIFESADPNAEVLDPKTVALIEASLKRLD